MAPTIRLRCNKSTEQLLPLGTKPRIAKPPPEPPKPILLAKSRIDRVVKNAFNTADIKLLAAIEEQHARNERLKKGSDELVALFTMNMQRTQAQKKSQRAAYWETKMEAARKSHELYAAEDEKLRQEKLMHAQQMLEKMKPGPRMLHTAALHSEVLRVRGVQTAIKEEFQAAQERALKKSCDDYNPRFWEQHPKQTEEERQQMQLQYARELIQTVAQKEMKANEDKKQRIAEEKAILEKIAIQAKLQEEKEKAIAEKKRLECQQNFESDMKMKARYKKLSQMEEEILTRSVCIYDAGKYQIDKMRKAHEEAMKEQRKKAMDANIQHFANYAKHAADRQLGQCLQKEVHCLTTKFLEKEEDEKRKEQKAKEERIAAYMQAMAEERERRRVEAEGKRFDLAQRLKNEEINCLFKHEQMAAQVKKAAEATTKLRNQMFEDMAAKETTPAEQFDAAPDCIGLRADKEDKFFFEYAHNLVADAVRKQRPLYPFAKAIKQYKRQNHFDCVPQLPAHMVTQISVGRSAAEKKSAASHANWVDDAADPCRKPSKEEKFTSAKEKALADCLRVEELLAANQKEEKNVCNTPGPIVCFTKGRGRPKSDLEIDGCAEEMPKLEFNCSYKPEPTINLVPVTICNS